MRPFQCILILGIFLFLLPSCYKEISESDRDFVGLWQKDADELEIFQEGSASYKYYQENDILFNEINNCNVIITENKLILKATFISKEFLINQRPTYDPAINPNTFMVLNGEMYIKK